MKSRDQVMISFMEDRRTHEYDILSIQEPWRNRSMNTTYHGKKEYFELEYNDSPDTRVCFFINKRLDPKSWTVTHHSPDAATVHLKVWRDEKESIINIHNFYNEPTPEGSGDFYVITQKLGETMDNIEKALRLEGEHILTGDFNLHHQAWAGHGETRHHNTAKILMELVNGAEMALTLPVGTITRERGEHRASTLDLIFISQSLLQNGELQICGRDKKLDHHSDHYPIHTILDLEVKQATPRKIRAWKKTDQETFIRVLQHHLQLTKTLLTKQEIDESGYQPSVKIILDKRMHGSGNGNQESQTEVEKISHGRDRGGFQKRQSQEEKSTSQA